MFATLVFATLVWQEHSRANRKAVSFLKGPSGKKKRRSGPNAITCIKAAALPSRMKKIRASLFAALILVFLLSARAAAFDTYWHAQATQIVGEAFGFTKDATDVMKLGNFSPDLFGPVEDYALSHLNTKQRQGLQEFGLRNAKSRAAAIFLHFDNLDGKLDRNSKIDYLFNQLLNNTRGSLAADHTKPDLDEATRNTLVLVTLGASLHTVQDFYSHSDWIHNDFDSTPVKMVRADSGKVCAPTWFQVRERLGDPDKWPFQVKSGIYPPVAGVRYTHTHMNHDNSRLLYREVETPAQPLVSQAQYHEAGPMPARPGEESSISRHQRLAVDTAIAASIEWVNLVEQNPDAKAAIESAKGWEMRGSSLAPELAAGLALELTLSCAAGRWDGEDPPADRGILCKVMNEKVGSLIGGMNPLTSGPTSGWKSRLQELAGGVGAAVAFPSALQYGGTFWDVHGRYQILEQLTKGFGSDAETYSFSQK
jgi:hypothetical protein